MARRAGLLGALPAQPLRPDPAPALPPAWLCTNPQGVMEGGRIMEATLLKATLVGRGMRVG